MIAVVQRVARAQVTACWHRSPTCASSRFQHQPPHSSESRAAREPVESAIERGLVALLGVERGDAGEQADWMADKLAALRVFPDEQGKMNRSVLEIGGSVMVVSQFTLAGELRKGTRPNFMRAAPPDQAEPLIQRVADRLEREHGVQVARGVFGASMRVELVNDGPVTLILQRRAID